MGERRTQDHVAQVLYLRGEESGRSRQRYEPVTTPDIQKKEEKRKSQVSWKQGKKTPFFSRNRLRLTDRPAIVHAQQSVERRAEGLHHSSSAEDFDLPRIELIVVYGTTASLLDLCSLHATPDVGFAVFENSNRVAEAAVELLHLARKVD